MKKMLLCLTFILTCATAALAVPPVDPVLSWIAPTTYEDGAALTPAGYKIYCGTSTGVYTITQDVGNMAEVKTSDFLPTNATYFCAATVYDSLGVESAYSNEVSFPLAKRPARVILRVK